VTEPNPNPGSAVNNRTLTAGRTLTDRYKRQQRRRAVIAWTTALLFAGLFVGGVIIGGGESHKSREQPSPFGYTMTMQQYAELRAGLEETRLVNRLEQTGLPENLTKSRIVNLFPPHGNQAICTYWDIVGHPDLVARVCFSNPQGRLIQKLERSAARTFGVNA
jgi:hypothetical protein